MGWMPRRLILLLGGSALLLAPLLAVQLSAGAGRAYACSCAEPPPPLETLERVDAVFTGRVVSFRTFSFELEADNGWTLEYWSVEFEVDRVWKGTVARTTFVYTTHGPTCGYPWFEQGESFLIYARHGGYAEVDEDALFVGQCSRIAPLEYAQNDLQELAEGQAPKAGVAGADPLRTSRDSIPSLAWWAPLLAGIAAAALIIRRWARRREPE